jgi:hypothetical protein
VAGAVRQQRLSRPLRADDVLAGAHTISSPPDLGLAALTLLCGLHGLGGRLSPLLAGLACGAWGYATLWTIGAMFSRDIHAVGVVLMLTATALVGFCCHGLVSTSRPRVD